MSFRRSSFWFGLGWMMLAALIGAVALNVLPRAIGVGVAYAVWWMAGRYSEHLWPIFSSPDSDGLD